MTINLIVDLGSTDHQVETGTTMSMRKKDKGQGGVGTGVSGGQFSEKTNTAPGPSATLTTTASDDVDKVVARLPERVDLYYVAYDDELTDEQVDSVLGGGYWAMQNALDGYDDQAYAHANEIAEQAWNAAYEAGEVDREYAELDYDEEMELRDAIYERDSSDPLTDLTRNTRSQLMRARLHGGSLGAMVDAAYNDGIPEGTWNGLRTFNEDGPEAEARIQARCDTVAKVLSAKGLDTDSDEARAAIRELVDNGPYDWHDGVRMDVIFYGDITDAAASSEAGATTSLSFANPRVVLMDTVNGSGHDVQLPGSLTTTFTAPDDSDGTDLDREDRAFLDSTEPGYGSWDKVCGLHKPAYATEITRTVTVPPVEES